MFDMTLLYNEKQDSYGMNGPIIQDVPKAVYQKDKSIKGQIIGNSKDWATQERVAEAMPGNESGKMMEGEYADDLPFLMACKFFIKFIYLQKMDNNNQTSEPVTRQQTANLEKPKQFQMKIMVSRPVSSIKKANRIIKRLEKTLNFKGIEVEISSNKLSGQ